MTESIKQRLQRLETLDGIAIRKLLEAILADNAALRVDIAAQATAMDVLAAKLNADAGVTDVNYSVANAAAVTSTTPDLVA